MTCIAGSPDCIGNVALADREVAFNQQINAITPHDGVDHRYLYVLLLLGKRLIQAASTNSMKGMVSKGRLEDVLVPAPPPRVQAEFGEAFDRVLALVDDRKLGGLRPIGSSTQCLETPLVNRRRFALAEAKIRGPHDPLAGA